MFAKVDGEIGERMEKAKPDMEAHGTEGLVKVCLPQVMEKGVEPVLRAVVEKSGEKHNLDFNSGRIR
jgi:hypothetical protein